MRCILNIFTYVKAAVTTRQAAIFYGLKVSASGMTCCPFHSDQHPSMKVDERYYCFGCHQTGDVIDFVSKLFGLTPFQAAQKLADDFGLHPSPSNSAVLPVPTRQPVETARNREGHCDSTLTSYEQLLKIWKECYAPPNPESDWDVRYIASCNALPQVSYLLDCLTSADAKERAKTTDALLHDQTLDKINSFLADHPAADANMAA